MNDVDHSNIHRFLDEAFAAVPMSPETQDLKEEIRANLSARVGELISAGVAPDEAATRAIAELGDIRELVDSVEQDATARGAAPTTEAGRSTASWTAAQQLNRVRPRPAFVARTVILSVVIAVVIVIDLLATFGVLDWGVPALVVIAVVGGLSVGALVDDALLQETTQHFPMPPARAALFGVSAALLLTGLLLAGLAIVEPDAGWALILGAVLALAAILGLVLLGTTQTNRIKPWVRTQQRETPAMDRFSQDPAAAARFGIYTVVIALLTVAGFIILSVTVGFAWSWISILLGVAVFMFTLARMLFPRDGEQTKHPEN